MIAKMVVRSESVNMNGILLVDKPSGCTSHDVVRVARRALGTRKVGHAGTLDPLASGLLIMLIGQATKLSDYILNGQKGYEVELLLGVETDSFDVTGKVIEEKPVTGTDSEALIKISKQLEGTIQLPVPSFSAVKVDGRKLYEYARAGEEVPVVTRESVFSNVELLQAAAEKCRFSMKCSKGSFIRAWVQEFGQILGCGATVNELRRNWSEPFTLEKAISFEDLEAGRVDAGFFSMVEALPHWSLLEVDGFEEKLMLNGQIAGALKGQILHEVASSGPGVSGAGIRVVSRADRHLVALLAPSQNKGVEICRVFPRI